MKLFLLTLLISLGFVSACGMYEKDDDEVEVIYKEPKPKEEPKDEPKEISELWGRQ